MKRYTTTITKQGRVCLTQVAFTLESAHGSVKPSRRPEDFEEVSRLAKEDKVRRTARKLRRRA